MQDKLELTFIKSFFVAAYKDNTELKKWTTSSDIGDPYMVNDDKTMEIIPEIGLFINEIRIGLDGDQRVDQRIRIANVEVFFGDHYWKET